jgi:hypothetical protein
MSAAGRLVRGRRFYIIAGWIASILGMALWTYAYFVTGTPSLIPWGNFLPPWAAEWLPNLEAEIGVMLLMAGSVPLYWDMWRRPWHATSSVERPTNGSWLTPFQGAT